ncbi:diguanylate cyclase [Jiella sp. MQZ9-1]|uniref:diguanylate cyclase n=1 Tax=Jiella flava TaxID=2816857 RepID=A0A939JV75_9HYPH|nr:diguanylate cyclase [Jiella flava]MBO0662149.1 diguanylate cyclase [Jiella flava]MCD2470522.1 diguanylate cyclase [Jiella flava]
MFRGANDKGSAGPKAGIEISMGDGGALGESAASAQSVVVFEDADHLLPLMRSVCDLGLGAVDGGTDFDPETVLAVLISWRADPELQKATLAAQHWPVIFIAEDGGFESRLKATRAGVTAVLIDPIDITELGSWLNGFDETRKPAPSIVIVDDDVILSELYAAVLEAAGMYAHIVNDPRQALDAINMIRPDLVLLDIEMPNVNGLELASVLRQSRRNLSTPIVFLSAERDEDKQQAARNIGGDDFISKPVDLDRLAAVVRMRADRAIALKQIIESDSLTGLLNHARFKERLALEMERSARTGSPLSVCILDIDKFKSVNDRYGHQVGDKVIQTLSQALTGGLRRTDVVARYGGEEFAIILLDTDVAGAAVVMNRIRERFGEIILNGAGEAFSTTFSAGIAQSTDRAKANDVLAMADARLYQAKATGRNRIVVG